MFDLIIPGVIIFAILMICGIVWISLSAIEDIENDY